MLEPYESLSSTGEPPTVSQESSSSTDNLCSTQALSSGDAETSHMEGAISPLSSGTRSRTLSVQEPDSGYEASPSSIADNQRFFGEQTLAVANQVDLLQACSDSLYSDEEFDFLECHSQTLYYESEANLEDYDTCQDCCSSFLACSCSRTDSSSTNATAISNCDTSRCNSSDLSYNRPSSQPIQVPTQQSCRISPEVRSRLEHSLGSLLDMYPRSLPINFGNLHSLGLISENHRLSWPSAPHSALSIRRHPIALPSPRAHHMSSNVDIPRRFNHSRNRRQIIDSDASSCTSDDEGPEDVFSKLSSFSFSKIFVFCVTKGNCQVFFIAYNF